MNFRLQQCEEWAYTVDEEKKKRELKMKGLLGDVLIRCNNGSVQLKIVKKSACLLFLVTVQLAVSIR